MIRFLTQLTQNSQQTLVSSNLPEKVSKLFSHLPNQRTSFLSPKHGTSHLNNFHSPADCSGRPFPSPCYASFRRYCSKNKDSHTSSTVHSQVKPPKFKPRAADPIPKEPRLTPKQLLQTYPKTIYTALAGLSMGAFSSYYYYKHSRFLNTVAVAVGIGIDYKMSLYGVPQGEAQDQIWKACHARSAAKLVKVCDQNGGIFVKLGQHIAALWHILPMEYVNAFRQLQDQVSFLPYETVRKTIHRDLGMPPEVVFDSFNSTPIASASLAQVHMARYRGKKVAVKVQYDGLEKQVEQDIETISFLVDKAAQYFPEFKLDWLIREFKYNLPKELDFRTEARNGERTATIFKNDPQVATPQIFWDVTSKNVLTMEFIEGCKITDVEKLNQMGISKEDVAKLYIHTFSRQIFLEGFVHCDPHPGNIFIRKTQTGKPQLVLLDNGLYREYSDAFRLAYANLWLSILNRDEDGIKKYAHKVSGGHEAYKIFVIMLTARDFWDL